MKRNATQTLFSCQFSIGFSHNKMLSLCYNDNRAASPWRYSLILMCVMLACANTVGVVLRCPGCVVARLLVNAPTSCSLDILSYASMFNPKVVRF